MKNKLITLSALLCMGAIVPDIANAQEDIAVLKQRIAVLEEQNQQILQQLAQLNAERKDKQPAQTPTPEKLEEVTLPAAVVTEGNKSRLSFYGFARVDAIYDDSRPNAAQLPTHILTEPPGAANNDNFTLHPRLTRMGLNYNGLNIDLLGGSKISARIETDFQNGGSESRAIMRYRHAYAKLDWAHSSLLLGQTWDIISPLYPTVNPDTMMWNAGNLGDRRVQLRYTYTPNSSFSFTAGLALTGAVNMQDLDGNGVRDGEDSGTPHFQGRAGYKTDRFYVGVWGHYAREETVTAFNGATDFASHSVGVDFSIQPLDLFSVKGEFWTGSGLGDVRGGIGQSINTLTGREIDSTGGWIELGFKPASS
ncbi:MAG: hypothetical protein A3F68_00650 [Acidobacteria bacterium RIFCSPLOWO2_12_FULL_54_10]|nr:MAG: hypothetical protein A3F68_00650 [Acidobacteria bacterium RIFCSPLOWO2_12_FULL_54_10]